MRLVRSTLLLASLFGLSVLGWTPTILAQNAGTPVTASPVAADALSARLGGTLESLTAVYGPPDFTGDGLVRYDSVTLNGLPTILVVYHDAAGQITKVALVYASRPDALAASAGVLSTAATVAPADGSCDASSVSPGTGNEVYACHSQALAGAFTADQMSALGATGEPGDYSIAVNPLPDAYFELVILPGSNGAALPATAVPAEPTPVPTPTLAQQYPPLEDPQDLMDGAVPLDEPLSFTGEILTLQVAGTGKQFHLGEDESLGVSSLFQVRVPGSGASDGEVIFVGFDGDASDLAIGDRVTVYGTNYGTQCFENAMGDEICQPLIAADLVVEE